MLRFCVLMSLVVMISAFSLNMCEMPRKDPRKVIPIVCEPGMTQSNVSKINLKKMVYEATFENDRIVIRPMRRRRKMSYCDRLIRKTIFFWHGLKKKVQSIVTDYIMR